MKVAEQVEYALHLLDKSLNSLLLSGHDFEIVIRGKHSKIDTIQEVEKWQKMGTKTQETREKWKKI